jgi:hypothetical protein
MAQVTADREHVVFRCRWEGCDVTYTAVTSSLQIATAHAYGFGWRPLPWGGHVCPGHH